VDVATDALAKLASVVEGQAAGDGVYATSDRPSRSAVTLFAVPLLLLAIPSARGAEPSPEGARKTDDSFRAFLTKHCQECHSGGKPKGDFRLDQLAPDFDNAANRDRWLAVRTRVQTGEMPPKAKPRPAEKDVRALVGWINAKAAATRHAPGRTVLRRLNRVEYQNTVRDLLGIDVDFQELLPADSSANGFDTAGEAMHVSSFLMEKYLEAADTALGLAIANGPRPPLIRKRYSLKDQHHVKVATERVFRVQGDTVVLFSSSAWNAVHIYQFYPPDRGLYRFRISARAIQSAGKPVTYGVSVTGKRMAGTSGLVGYFDAPAEQEAVAEFVEFMEPRTTLNILPYGLANAQTVDKSGADKYQGPGLAVQWVEVEGPLYDTWPPESHRRIFTGMRQKPAPVFNDDKRVEVVSDNPEADAGRILRHFARRAFRRRVTDAEVKPFVGLVKRKLAAKQSFEQAVRVGLAAILVSPDFLFLGEKPGRLDDFALASRLSYFLWSTMPDEDLLTLAERGELSRPETLRGQVERMLKHPKAVAFTENFVGQWLGLREIDATEPSFLLYPEFDHMLKVSMIREAELFFAEVLKDDLSLTNFVASDFTMLNARLARHYGVPGPAGFAFRKVMLPPGSHRGGVLTMAGVLKGTANGTTTSPVPRGVWVMDRILGTPPPRPPPDVPAIQPDIRGATTIREQLARHRQSAACASCHARIDPPGFALESFDVIGGWRERYRTTGNGDGKEVIVDGRRMPYHMGRKVEPSDVMPDGSTFQNIDELKRLLLQNRDRLARALAGKLLTYATGVAPEGADAAEIDAIVKEVRRKHYGLRSLVHEIVQSRLFQTK
jgi:mono/diheme cytochrome c family protein